MISYGLSLRCEKRLYFALYSGCRCSITEATYRARFSAVSQGFLIKILEHNHTPFKSIFMQEILSNTAVYSFVFGSNFCRDACLLFSMTF